MKSSMFIHEFNIKIKNLSLSREEELVLEKLVAAGKMIGRIYKKQFDADYLGSNFYPHDATFAEIEKAAQKDKSILDPYTIVERNDKGDLVAIPYHKKYAKELTPVIKLIGEAAEETKDKDFNRYLRARVTALKNGLYEETDIVWLTTKQFKINFVIGPIERYDDKLFFRKCSYQSWVGVLNKNATKEAVDFRDVIFSSQRKIIAPEEKVRLQEKVTLRVDDTLLFSGLISRFMFTGVNLPNDVRLMEKYGSVVTIFLTCLDEKFEEQHYPIFQKVFEKSFQALYTKEQLRLGTFRNILVHEIAHPLLRFRGAEDRLKNLFPVFDEISAYVYGVKSCGLLLLKDVITQKELEAIMVMFLCRAFTWWEDYQKDKGVIQYLQGYAIALNFLSEAGAIREHNGIFWPNFTKFFVCLEELASVLERILAEGTYSETKNFLTHYGSLSTIDQFARTIRI